MPPWSVVAVLAMVVGTVGVLLLLVLHFRDWQHSTELKRRRALARRAEKQEAKLPPANSSQDIDDEIERELKKDKP